VRVPGTVSVLRYLLDAKHHPLIIMGFLRRKIRELRQRRRDEHEGSPAIIRMISGCADHEYSTDLLDVSSVSNFMLPSSAGRNGGACTGAILGVLYKDHHERSEDLSYTQVLEEMREIVRPFDQVPQVRTTLRGFWTFSILLTNVYLPCFGWYSAFIDSANRSYD